MKVQCKPAVRQGDIVMKQAKTSSRMTKFGKCCAPYVKLLGFMVGLFFVAQPSFAYDRGNVVGLWQLVSYEIEVQTTGEKVPVMGQKPTGFANFSPEGRVFFILTGEGRKPAKTDQERGELLSTLVAYTGTYRVEGDMWVTNVDVAWNPEWVGTEQRRSFRIDDDQLQVLTPWRVMPNWSDKGMTRSIVTFQRAKASTAGEFATREEAIAMVQKAVAFINEQGTEKAYAEIANKGGRFHDRDLYITVLDLDGKVLAHGQREDLIGTVLIEAKDPDGKLFVRERVELARQQPSFWQNYKFMNPATKKVEPKQMYCERLGETAVCGGVYAF
jgi:hypothetical protein